MQQAETVQLQYQDALYVAVYTDLVPNTSITSGSLQFEVKTPTWSVTYEGTVDSTGHLRYQCLDSAEVKIVRARSEVRLSEWLQANGLTFILDGDRLIDGDLLYHPKGDEDPFDRRRFVPIDWKGRGTTITVKSQTAAKLTDSIQFAVIEDLKSATPAWDIILDDDGTGEIADVVALRVDDDELVVLLVHCKFSHGSGPGTRVADVYEVCGQAQKSIRWRRNDLRPFFKTLVKRAQRKQQRTGVSPFEVGDLRALFALQDRASVLRRRVEMIIVQPGLSATQASEQQLDVLASTQAYLLTTINSGLEVWCSP